MSSGGHHRKKKVAKTPSAASFSSRFKKAANMKKTRVLQKMGKERTEYLPEFKKNNDSCKELQTLYTDFSRFIKSFTSTGAQAFANQGNLFADSLSELGEREKRQGILGPSLLQLASVQCSLTRECQNWHQLSAQLSNSIDRYLRDDILSARRIKNEFRDSRIQFDAADSTLHGAMTRPDRPRDLFLAQTHYHYAKRKFHWRHIDASNSMADAIEKKEFHVVHALAKSISSHIAQYAKTCNCLEEFTAMVPGMRSYVSQRRTRHAEHQKATAASRASAAHSAARGRFNALVELLSAPSLAAVNAISLSAKSAQKETLETLVRILDAYKLTLPIIKLSITQEVEKTATAATLFRGNTTPTKLMTAFTRMTGRPYLHSALKEHVEAIVADPQGFEVDPNKLPEGQDEAHNTEKLLRTVQSIFDAIMESLHACPIPFRVMANHLHHEVIKRFPDSGSIAVAGFIFLRFFCPAILAPDTAGMVSGPITSATRRPLVLISKVLQNLANGITFGKKEAYMEPFNERFIHVNSGRLQEFFDGLVREPESVDYDPLASMEEVYEKQLPMIHQHVVDHLEEIAETLVKYEQADTVGLLVHIVANV